MPPVQVDASRTNRSLASAASVLDRPQAKLRTGMKMYKRMIDGAVECAKKTHHGMPTDGAILDREWIQRRGEKTDEGSFEWACSMLDWNAEEQRSRLLAEIDDALTAAIVRHAGNVVYQRRAAVLTCAGVPTKVGRQFVLGLVSVEDWEQITFLSDAEIEAVRSERAARKRLGRSVRSRLLTSQAGPQPREGARLPGTGRGSSANIARCG